VYLATEVDAELVSLRERVGELEKESSSNCAVAMERGLLLEAVRWLMGFHAVHDSDIQRHLHAKIVEKVINEAPENLRQVLAPLIAEAVKP
jgi:hypothetical protein